MQMSLYKQFLTWTHGLRRERNKLATRTGSFSRTERWYTMSDGKGGVATAAGTPTVTVGLHGTVSTFDGSQEDWIEYHILSNIGAAKK